MFLSKEEYYKRRWFLTILFILVGFMLLYLSYGLFTYNKDKSDLEVINEVPKLIKIEKIKISGSPSVALVILIDENKKVSTIINDSVINKIASMFQIPNLNRYSFGSEMIFNKKNVNNKQYRYSYSKDRLYELKIDDVKILEYEKKSHFLGYLVLIIALGWLSFQIWVIYTLATKGARVKDCSEKPTARR